MAFSLRMFQLAAITRRLQCRNRRSKDDADEDDLRHFGQLFLLPDRPLFAKQALKDVFLRLWNGFLRSLGDNCLQRMGTNIQKP